ncbi:hypothetical protein Sjap_012266 [Stephania japonica]|uniref:GATA-type domain-containing protein n=1 Tax=Stephania japonica TaxID=461633 RepID=A0AAP0NY41_9MAGN
MKTEAEGSMSKCLACLTSCTPLWRNSPLGFKTLCNACGIRFKKRMRGGLPR